MAISIKNPLAEELARKVAQEGGESITQAIIHSLEERLERLQGRRRSTGIEDEILRISRRCSALPEIDDRSPEEILGYDERGLPSHGH
jgi:antitoxin VapB